MGYRLCQNICKTTLLIILLMCHVWYAQLSDIYFTCVHRMKQCKILISCIQSDLLWQISLSGGICEFLMKYTGMGEKSYCFCIFRALFFNTKTRMCI